jgi:hypothetical protein
VRPSALASSRSMMTMEVMVTSPRHEPVTLALAEEEVICLSLARVACGIEKPILPRYI